MKTLIIIILILFSMNCNAQDLNTGYYISSEGEAVYIAPKNKNLYDQFIINPPVFKPSLDFALSTGIHIIPKEKTEHEFIISPFDYENAETVFIINSKEVLRFYEDSIIIYFKGKTIVITDDSLCKTLNRITEETFK